MSPTPLLRLNLVPTLEPPLGLRSGAPGCFAQAGGRVTRWLQETASPHTAAPPPLREDAGNFSALFPEKNLTQTQRFGINLLSSPSSGTNQILHSRAVSGPEAPQRVDEPGWNFLVNKGQRWAA